MQLNINIHETVNGDLFVKELAYEQGAYAGESLEMIPLTSPKFSQSVSITLLTKHSSLDTTNLKAFVHDHRVTEVSNKFKVKQDGWYEITHLVVPNEKWLEAAAEQEILTNYKEVYICKNEQLYRLEGQMLVTVTIEDMLESESLADSNVWMAKKNVFVLFNLWQCYLNYCKKMLEGECSQNSKCSDCDNELTKNRNLIWIFLNAIQYMVKFGELQKAQEFLENISGCNTLCSNEMFSKQYDCGCGK